LAGLSAQERLEAVTNFLQNMAREVVDNQDLGPDDALLENGLDSLSGVEFRNRLVAEFETVRMPNSLVFDHPTVNALALFINEQLGETPAAQASSASAPAVQAPAAEAARLIEPLNDRTSGAPLFLVPGAGMQAGGFRTLAGLLPVPAYGFSWPKGAFPREQWPTTLVGLAKLFFEQVQLIQPEGPYHFAGHSFGASVVIEMAKIAQSCGVEVTLVGLLDARSLPPFNVDIGSTFSETTLVDSLALLSETAADGSKFVSNLDDISKATASGENGEAALRRLLNPAVVGMLEHVHETTQWYSHLLGTHEASEVMLQTAKVVTIAAEETWLLPKPEAETLAQAMVRAIQSKTFQSNAEVAQRVAASCGSEAVAAKATGTHFSMLHEPSAVGVALTLCGALNDLANSALSQRC
jgi:thioesterase domain-containing protein/aryl carrier-like protein